MTIMTDYAVFYGIYDNPGERFFLMECTTGNLGQEIQQPSNPYVNLSQCGLLQCQVNALKVMVPDLNPPPCPYLKVRLISDKAMPFFVLKTGTLTSCGPKRPVHCYFILVVQQKIPTTGVQRSLDGHAFNQK